MKLILRNKEVFVKTTLEDGDVDVSNIANWYGMQSKKGYSSSYIYKQITAYVNSKGGEEYLDEYDKGWYVFTQGVKASADD